MQSTQNRLAQESSLYLRQHADNPVDWYPWGSAAFKKARDENKPILLSIGYSACHWCHVMAQESFADPETAKIMNELFVSIKVDREERPDLDKIYQLTHQMLTGRGGGWPLTLFLTPEEHLPFFAGTYFPYEPRYGMPSFKQVLKEMATIFREKKEAITEQNRELTRLLEQTAVTKTVVKDVFDTKPLSDARAELRDQFDAVNGGFGGAPKFPNPTYLEFLLREGESEIVDITLTKMALGGIYDQIGGGFFRYSVDAQWQIPHFEKMLYDNAQLLSCYAKSELFIRVMQETITWLQREMRSPEGGYYSTLDADSEHVEGKYYYWDREQIKTLLTDKEYTAALTYFGLDRPPNFEDHWHLHVAELIDNQSLHSACKKLLKAREQRVAPGRDEKILTSWNALLVKGLAQAGIALNKKEWIEEAQHIVDFIREQLWVKGRLLAIYQNNRAYLMAYLDDYAYLLDAILVLLKISHREENLQFAISLADVLLNHFFDKENGGFFFTADDHEKLIFRPKFFQDEAIPSGNGIAASALGRLGRLLNEARYLQAAEKTLRAAWPVITAYPTVHTSLLNALQEYLCEEKI